MAVVDNIVKKEITSIHGLTVMTAKLTGATSTITSVEHELSSLDCVNINVRDTNTMTYTVSGTTVTITGTNNDDIDCVIFGKK